MPHKLACTQNTKDLATVVQSTGYNVFQNGELHAMVHTRLQAGLSLARSLYDRGWHVAYVTFLLIACLLFPVQATGTLGKSEEQISKVAAGLNLEKVETQSVHGYTIKVLSSHDLAVKEYVNPKTSLVFGVTWRGTRMPDLQLLLGFDPATLKGKETYWSLHYSTVRTPTLVLVMAGHPGRYAGRAVRIDLLPEEVTPTEIAP